MKALRGFLMWGSLLALLAPAEEDEEEDDLWWDFPAKKDNNYGKIAVFCKRKAFPAHSIFPS